MAETSKTRGPIAAMYASPGPMVYTLPTLTGSQKPDPRSNHIKNPSWVFGIRHGKFYDDASPGPVYYPDMKTTKTGKDGTPHYSLYSRTADPTVFKTPGPGAYSPEHVGPSAHHMSPRYSFGGRTRLRQSDKNPAPNSYSLPGLLGKTVESGKKQSPSYTQRGRTNVGSFCEDLQKTPGPGTYNKHEPNITKGKAPSYSLGNRRDMPGDGTKKPGPGAHSPEKVSINKPKAPQYGFGTRHSDYLTPLIVAVED